MIRIQGMSGPGVFAPTLSTKTPSSSSGFDAAAALRQGQAMGLSGAQLAAHVNTAAMMEAMRAAQIIADREQAAALLQANGYPIATPVTAYDVRTSLTEYQRARGLPLTGTLDAATRADLERPKQAAPPPPPPPAAPPPMPIMWTPPPAVQTAPPVVVRVMQPEAAPPPAPLPMPSPPPSSTPFVQPPPGETVRIVQDFAPTMAPTFERSAMVAPQEAPSKAPYIIGGVVAVGLAVLAWKVMR